MKKLVAAIIKKDDKVLLIHRPGQHADFWEFPGGQVAEGDRIANALKLELYKELGIAAEIGKMITSAKNDEYEVFAYDVKIDNNTIELYAHDNIEWVPLNKALKYKLLPEHKKIVTLLTNTKEEKQLSDSLDSVISKVIEKPEFDEHTQKYIVRIKNPLFGATSSFSNQATAMNFYIETVRYILKSAQINRHTR